MYAFSTLLMMDIFVVAWLYPEERDLTFWVSLASTFGVFAIWAAWSGWLLEQGRGRASAITLLSIILGMALIGAILTYAVYKPEGGTGRPAWAEWLVHTLRGLTGAYVLFAWVLMIRTRNVRRE